MSFSPSASWRKLPRPTKSGCPRLFYFFSTEDNSLTIKLTDLVVLWECSLDRTGIIDAAKAQQTSIDPSESSGQLRVLLEKLEQSLNSGANRLSRSTDINAQTVYLKTELDLPRPLKPLSWIFELNPKDAAELAEQLFRPCLHEASIAKQKLESLIRVIKEKDHVLSRLLEKVDSSSIDLSLIFPGVAGLRSRKRHVTTKEAQKHIPGMAEFDQARWNKTFDAENPYAGFHQLGMNNLVAGCERCPEHSVEEHTDWLKGLPVRDADADTETAATEKKGTTNSGASGRHQSDASTDTESDFERHPTPPHIKNKWTTEKRRQQSRSSTRSSSLDENMRPSKRPKLGQVGGFDNRNKPKRPSHQEPTSPKPESSTPDKSRPADLVTGNKDSRKQNSGSETETASETENDPKQPSDDQKSSVCLPAKQVQTRTQLGRLGRLASQLSKTESGISHSSSPQAQSPSGLSASNSQPQRGGRVNTSPKLKSSQRQPSRSKTRTTPDSNKNKRKNSIAQLSSESSKQEQEQGQEQKHALPSKVDNDAQLPATPSRKLGRLKNPRSGSTVASTGTPTKTPIRNKEKKITQSPTRQTKTDPSDTDTDTETASEADNENKHNPHQPLDDTPIPAPLSLKPHPSSSSTSPPDPDTRLQADIKGPSKPETVQEKADRRREELKKRLNTGGAAKKVRKF